MNTQVMTGKDYAEWLLAQRAPEVTEVQAPQPKRLLTEAEMLEELEDLREGMADEEFHRSGSW